MSNIELTAILFYADYLSLEATSTPVTDNCKYFYIHGIPVNSAYILGMVPEYDEDNEYFKLALTEYTIIRDLLDDDAVLSFIDDICSIRACGTVDANRMLNKIHLYSNKQRKREAFNTYKLWKSNQQYYHTISDEDGYPIEGPCTKYVYHAERMLGRPGLVKSLRDN